LFCFHIDWYIVQTNKKENQFKEVKQRREPQQLHRTASARHREEGVAMANKPKDVQPRGTQRTDFAILQTLQNKQGQRDESHL